METNDPSGQKLRWWTQETANAATTTPTKSRWYNEPVEQTAVAPPATTPVPAAPLNLWEELEAEARQRNQLEAQAVTVAGDTRQIVTTTRKRWAYTVLPAILICTAIMIGIQSWALLPMIAFLVLEILLLDWMVRSMYKKGAPRMQISPLGLTLQMPSYTLGPIFWDEIKSIRVRRFMYGSYLEIAFKDQKATYARALHYHDKESKGMTWLLKKSKSLTLMDTIFSTPAKDIAAQIARFRPDLLEKKKRG